MDFVYDRTQDDVNRVIELNKKYIAGNITDDEKAEWAKGMKGAMNASDLNRIEENISMISEMLALFAETKSWTSKDIPDSDSYGRIRNNVQAIREAWPEMPNTPETPSQPLNTFGKWNDIEKILHDVYTAYERMIQSYYYCGDELFAGEGVGVI